MVAAVLIASCDELEPKHAEAPYLKSWILRNCIDASDRMALCDSYIESIGETTEDPQFFSDYCVKFFDRNVSIPKEEKYQEYITYFFNLYDEQLSNHEILSKDKDEAKRQITNLMTGYFDYVDEFAAKEVNVINWLYNENGLLSDKYTGYLVEYEIGKGYYVLLSLTEYDDSDRYTCEIIYQGNSLNELHQCYE